MFWFKKEVAGVGVVSCHPAAVANPFERLGVGYTVASAVLVIFLVAASTSTPPFTKRCSTSALAKLTDPRGFLVGIDVLIKLVGWYGVVFAVVCQLSDMTVMWTLA